MRKTLPPSHKASAELTSHHGNVQGPSKGHVLPVKYIIQKFGDNGLQLDITILRQPVDRERTEFFGSVSLNLTGKCLSHFTTAYDEQFDFTMESHLYKDALFILRFSKHLAWFIKKLTLNGFGLQDLFNCENQRIRYLFSSIATFLDFIEHRSTQYDSLINHERELQIEAQENLRSRDELKQILSKEKAALEKLSPEITRKSTELLDIYLQISNLRAELHHLKEDGDTLKLQISSDMSIGLEKNSEKVTFQNKSKKLKELISKNTLPLENDISIRKTQASEIDKKIVILDHAVARRNKLAEEEKELANKITTSIAPAVEIVTERVKVKEIVNIVDELKTNYHTLLGEQVDVNAQLENLKDKMERFQNRERDYRKKEEDLKSRKLEEIEQYRAMIARESIEADNKASGLKASKGRKDKLEQEASSLISKADADFSLFTRKISEAKECVNVYLEALDSSFAEFAISE